MCIHCAIMFMNRLGCSQMIYFSYLSQIVAPKGAGFYSWEVKKMIREEEQFTSSLSSWGGAQPECWEELLPVQW